MLGNRLGEKRNKFCFPPHLSFPNIQCESDSLMKYYGAGYGASICVVSSWLLLIDPDATLTWDKTIPWLKKNTSLQIWLKGSEYLPY